MLPRWPLASSLIDILPPDYFAPSKEGEGTLQTEECLDMLAQLDNKPLNAETQELQHLANLAFYGDSHPIAKDILAHGPCLGPSFARKYRHLIEA